MKTGTAKTLFWPLGAFLFVGLFWACSLNIETTNPFPQENPNAANSDTAATPGSVLTPDTSTPDTSVLDSLPRILIPRDSLIIVPEETTFVKDTIVFRDTLVLYKDTIYDTLYDTTSYNSFVYRKYLGGMLDTVTRWSKLLNCDVGDTAFSCTEKPNYSGKIPMCGLSLVATKCCKVEYELVKLDTNAVYVHVHDTLYKDTFHIQRQVCVNDTTFINYGETRVMDYIPPEEVYVAPANAFDSTEMRSLLDTLDFSAGEGEEVKYEIKKYSYLQFNGLPLLVQELMPLDTVAIAIGSELQWKHWPDTTWVKERTFYIKNTDLESDTTVTWTLKYTHYETERSETDSIQVTSFIKVK